MNESDSLTQVLQVYLSLFRLVGTRGDDFPSTFNVWNFGLENNFPYLRLKSLTNSSHLFSTSFLRVIFVRHPLERLASAYSQKIAIPQEKRPQSDPFYDQIRKKICDLYSSFNASQRQSPKSLICQHHIPSFTHFVEYVLHEDAHFAWRDSHWQSYSSLCDVCKFNYNFIGKIETMNKDFPELLEYLNLSEWNARKRRNPSGQTSQHYRALFVPLKDELICRLKQLYADDFRLFDYRLEDYVDRPGLDCDPSLRVPL
jgi:Sulfotransferase family